MPSKYQAYRQMADTAERQLTSSYKWMGGNAKQREPFDQSGVWGVSPQQAKGDFRYPEISLFVKFV